MGTGAANGRRALVENVQEAIAQTNAMTRLATEVREANNKLAQQTALDVARLDTRADGLGKWCKENAVAAGVANERVTNLRGEIAHFLLGLSFRQRLRWLLFGGSEDLMLPTSAAPAPPPSAPEKAVVRGALFDYGTRGPMTGCAPIQHTTRGPRLLP